MRHLDRHERSLIALTLLHAADRWGDLADNMAHNAPRVAQSLRVQAAYARALADDVSSASGVVLL